jgi:hypothetical protein
VIYSGTIDKEPFLRHKFIRAFSVFAMLFAAASLWAHHSPSAVFDMSKKFTVSGTLTKLDWINPHIVAALDVKGDDGKVQTWKLESNPPSWFRRVGVNRSDIAKAVGQTVTIEAVRAKDGSLYGYMQKLTMADGTSWELVSENEK